jgi:hypothetical protein
MISNNNNDNERGGYKYLTVMQCRAEYTLEN